MDEIKISVVSFEEISDIWSEIEDFLVKGLTANSEKTLGCLLARLYNGEETLWIIEKAGKPFAFFVTGIVGLGNGRTFVGVSNLGGSGLSHWAKMLASKMEQYARAMGCKSVRFYGRRAWARVLPGYRVIGGPKAGQVLFERAV